MFGDTALIRASSRGHGSIVDSLLRDGASLNLQTTYGATALSNASRYGHTSIKEALIEGYKSHCFNGVDPNNSDATDATDATTVTTARALCLTTLLTDDFSYLNVDSNKELVQTLLAEEI